MCFAAFIIAMLWLFGLYMKRGTVAPIYSSRTTIIITVRDPHVNVIEMLPHVKLVEQPSGENEHANLSHEFRPTK